ncbi:Rust resistance kinase Lr10 [Linum grandiflorum]
MSFISKETTTSSMHLFSFISVLLAANHGAAVQDSFCRSSFKSCGGTNSTTDYHDIRFPFTIKGRPSDYHGYPGFELSCATGSNQPLIHLPNSVNLTVLSIDYESQVIHAKSPNDCLPAQLLHLNLVASMFQINVRNYTFLDCSPAHSSFSSVPCLGSTVDAYYSDYALDDVDLVSCTKMYDIPLPDSWPNSQNLELSWSKPDCSRCYKSKGQCCVLKQGSHEPEALCWPGYTNHNKESLLKKGLIAGVVLGSVLIVGFLISLYLAYKHDRKEREYRVKINKFLDDYKSLKPTRFTYADIKRITNQFSCELGRGAYGAVFKGKLSAEIQVAVKVLNSGSKGNGEEFVNEVGTMARIHHVNVVRLIGFCADGFRRALVYEYLQNDTLQKYISSYSSKLDWNKLQDIALGVAKGIEYLHQGCENRILHFDIKPHNILLDHDFNPKVSDFGLSKLCAKDQSAISMTTARGTIGYIAPEVFSRNFGSVSYKADVYSFGMLLLEMVGGRKNVDETAADGDQIYFPEWIYNLFDESVEDVRVEIEAQEKEGKEDEEEDKKIGKKLAAVGLWCIQWKPSDRPTMKLVVQMLEGEGDSLTPPPNPVASSNGGGVRMTRLQGGGSRVPRMAVKTGMESIPETE